MLWVFIALNYVFIFIFYLLLSPFHTAGDGDTAEEGWNTHTRHILLNGPSEV